MDLSARQRRVMALLLHSDHEVTLRELAKALDVSSRTVQRELSSLEPHLGPWGLRIRGRTGHGVQIEGDLDLIKEFRSELTKIPSRAFASADRQWVLATLLLECPTSLKVFALEQELGVGTTIIQSELNLLDRWLVPFRLKLVRRRGFGVAIEGSEVQKRLALEAALTQRFDEYRLVDLFWGSTERDPSAAHEFLFERFPRTVVSRIDQMVEEASKAEGWDWAPSARLALTLHLVTVLQRVTAGFRLDRVPLPQGDRGPARRLLGRLTESFGVDFSALEVDWTALHIETSKPNGSAPATHAATEELVRGVRALIARCSERAGAGWNDDPVLYEGLLAHWGPAYSRILHHLPISNALLPEIRARFPTLMDLVADALTDVFPSLVVPAEELGYLVLHFAASLERSQRDQRPFRALIVCASGIGTSYMLASRIRTELPEVEVVANLSWSDVKTFSRDRYDLLISTVPLPLPDDAYVVVSPLLDETGLRLLRDHVRRQRVRLALEPDPAPSEPPATMEELKAWNTTLGHVLTLVESISSFPAPAQRSWWAAALERLGLSDRPEPETVPPLILIEAPESVRASLSIHSAPSGRCGLLVVPSTDWSRTAYSVLLEGFSTSEVRAAVQSGTAEQVRDLLARALSRKLGRRPSQGE